MPFLGCKTPAEKIDGCNHMTARFFTIPLIGFSDNKFEPS